MLLALKIKEGPRAKEWKECNLAARKGKESLRSYPWSSGRSGPAHTLECIPSLLVALVKNLPANAGDVREVRSIPGLGRSLGGGNDNPLQYSCLENPWTEEPGGLQSMGSKRVEDGWSNLAWHKVNLMADYEAKIKKNKQTTKLMHIDRQRVFKSLENKVTNGVRGSPYTSGGC